FDPTGALTRGMVATVLWRREGSPASTAPSGFTDVPAGAWYADAVAWAKQTGVVNGMTETTFAPNAFITREQLATMLFRFSSSAPVSVPERADLSPFADDEKTSAWAKESLEWAVEAGLINGTDGNRLAPSGNATREQFAAIIERYDGSFELVYNEPVPISHFTEKPYPLVDDADFYVSTAGDDSADGSFGHPFRTWERARDAVRTLDKTGRHGIKVAFMAGDYGPLSIELTAEDSGTPECPITYCKYGDGDVVFDNGTTVKESDFLPLTDGEKAMFSPKSADRIKKADVTGKLDNFTVFDLVLSEDGEMTVARYPNKYYDGTDSLLQGGHTVDESHISIYNQIMKNRILKYKSVEGLYLYGFITLGWYKDLIETDGMTVDPQTGDPVFHVINLDKTRGGRLRFEEGFEYDYYSMAIVNVPVELDIKGEFILSRDKNTLYVYDPSGDYSFMGGGDMIAMDHADFISFVGLTLKNSRERLINASASHDVTVDGCTFSGSASPSAVYFEKCGEGRPFNITVKNSDFSFTASYSLDVEMVGTGSGRHEGKSVAEFFDTAGGVLIDNNRFYKSSLVVGNTGAVGVDAVGPVVTHNEFVMCYWCGLDYSGTINMLAAYNVFDRTCYNGEDTGALNTWYSTDYCGNVVRNNLFVNVRYFGLYLDDVVGTRVESNVFYNCSQTPTVNNGICKYNAFCNNVILYPDSEHGIGCDYRTGGTESVLRAMDGNDDPSVLTSVGDWGRWRNVLQYYYDHHDLMAKAAEMWPGYFDITFDVTRWREPEYCSNNSLVITGNREVNKIGAQKEYSDLLKMFSVIEDNAAYAVTENPLFVNPTRGDYRIRDGADCTDVEFENIGRY
ncbi:MAG: S-layer homology domain-containing protein, partial [Clostridia bacterium]|nr:S-layer homology domain-containing protein [Clostridia bacterium]